MTQDEIIRMAREAGFTDYYPERLTRFAALVAAHEREKQAEQEPVKVTGAMVYAFHHALTDGAIGASDFDEIKLGLEAAFANITAPVEPVEQEPVACIIHTKEGDYVDWNSKGYCFYVDETPLYAAPVSIESAVLAEREACAKVCEDIDTDSMIQNWKSVDYCARECAAAIRARGEK